MNKLQKLIQEHEKLFDDYIEIAQAKEYKQNNYVKHIAITNQTTGEVFTMSHSLQKKLTEQHSIFQQKVGYIHHLAKERDLTEVYFLTITAPSQYHPFRELKLNSKFVYASISEAIPESYKAVENISRRFYKALKERLRGSKIDDKLLYVKVNEFHESYIVHQHMMIMLPQGVRVYSQNRKKKVSLGLWARDKFYEILKKEDFNYSTHPYRKTNDFKKVVDDGRSISQYMMKYIQKTISMSKNDEYGNNIGSYFLYGWKSANNIRHCTTSNTPINQVEYQKLYQSLTKEEKEHLVSQANDKKTNLMIELSKVVSIQRKLIDYDGTKHFKDVLNTSNPIYFIESDTLKIKNYSDESDEITKSRKLQELVIHKDDELRYKKSNFSSQNFFQDYNQ